MIRIIGSSLSQVELRIDSFTVYFITNSGMLKQKRKRQQNSQLLNKKIHLLLPPEETKPKIESKRQRLPI
ncbi:hypothetical protein [Paenibacillus piscarius]|uniref:hypothetical protein n=1 Tax=Paenibacillus piscarius TaxID=1089681 RepID=UPI001EE976BF|nr:hypothetical protein [Paenibacillus piscarius]